MKSLIKNQKPNGWLREQPASPFSLLDEILKDDFFPAFSSDLWSRDFSMHMPAVNITDEADRYTLELSAPGFRKEDFKISVDEGHLVISSERKDENKDENKRYTRREFSYGTFRKRFALTEDVNEEAVSANYENGILLIHLPKKEEAKPKPAREIKIG